MAARHAVSGFPYPGQESQVMNAWDRLVGGAELPANAVRNVIEHSWARCLSAGVDPARPRGPLPAPDEALSELLHRFRDVIDVCSPVMDQVRESLSESGTIMILTDPSGVILKTEGDPATVEAAADVRLASGVSWAELSSGTNAIGTALPVKEPVQVHATEHFCAGVKPWSCAATVLCDPSGEILGVLDVSGLSNKFHRNWWALAMMGAGRIEADLAARHMESRWRLVEAGLQGLSRASSRAVMLFDGQGRLVKAEGITSRSRATVSECGEWRVGRHIEAFDSESGHANAALPDWLRPEWVQPVMRGGQRLGTVVILPDPIRREPTRRIGSRRDRRDASRIAAISPACPRRRRTVSTRGEPAAPRSVQADRRDQPGSSCGSRCRSFSPGLVLPCIRHHPPHPRAARAQGGHRRAGRAFQPGGVASPRRIRETLRGERHRCIRTIRLARKRTRNSKRGRRYGHVD